MHANTFPYRVLIVDDEQRLRDVGRAILESQGYQVHCAEDGFEGLASLKMSLPDMIISDLQMPKMNGFEFLSVIRARFPAIPVIVISGEFSGVNVPESVMADAFFAKGAYQPRELFEKISELLNSLPKREGVARSQGAAVWVRNDKGTFLVTCPECFRTFPMSHVATGINRTDCDSVPVGCSSRFFPISFRTNATLNKDDFTRQTLIS